MTDLPHGRAEASRLCEHSSYYRDAPLDSVKADASGCLVLA